MMSRILLVKGSISRSWVQHRTNLNFIYVQSLNQFAESLLSVRRAFCCQKDR
jgi:hypothetical protein